MLVGYAVVTCCSKGCGISFAVPSHWDAKRREDHSTWYCPNGHGQHYSGESEAEKLRRERDRLLQRCAEKDDDIRHAREARDRVQRSLSATKAVVTRVRRRVGNGVCPCCNRTFGDLAKHMKSKHAAYGQLDSSPSAGAH